MSFITKHNILFYGQFGFRKNHNTTMALVILTDKIMSAINNGEYVVGAFLDLSKAFDTVNHAILLKNYTNLEFVVSLMNGSKVI